MTKDAGTVFLKTFTTGNGVKEYRHSVCRITTMTLTGSIGNENNKQARNERSFDRA